MRGDATKVKVQYRVHQGGLKWSKVKSGMTARRTCRDGMTFALDLTRR